MKNKDCFAMKNGVCGALTVIRCDGCVFYKTKAQFKRDEKAARLRLRLLDADTQDYIAEKYYGGSKCW
jgi:hypothetical protein